MLGNDIELVVRCEHDAVTLGPSGELSMMNIKSLNEWDSRVRLFLSLLLLCRALRSRDAFMERVRVVAAVEDPPPQARCLPLGWTPTPMTESRDGF